MKKYFNSQDARNLISVYDFAIFPVHGVKQDGSCTCGAANCERVGKHPASPNGLKDATTDIEEVKALWQGRQFLNVGIATGKKSGISVIDVDNEQALKKLKSIVSDDIQTLCVKTGRGYHFYFAYEEGLKSKNDLLNGIDIKSDGGYVIGAKSNHSNGNVYEFENPLEVLAKFPAEIKALMEESGKPPPILTQSRSHLLNPSWSDKQTQEHLSYINPDCDYDTWIKIGMALHEEGKPFELWDEWSGKGDKYDGTTSFHWNSFNKGGGVTYGTIVALAKEGGWAAQKNAEKRTKMHVVETVEKFDPETGEVIESEEQLNDAFQLYYASDISPILETNDFVEDVLREKEFSVIYGESNCGKTFFMLDLAMHVALGRPWRGKEVEQGGVIYAALEGGFGTNNRICAFKQYYSIESEIPLAIIRSSVNFLDAEGDIEKLANSVKAAKEKIGNVKLIVIDTLARAISGGDENSSTDMGQMIIHADYLRSITSAHISFIHHSGKDKALGARGHSSLRAAVDTEIEISREDEKSPSQIKFVKQREMEMIDPLFFTLESKELGVDKRGRPVTSCAVIPCEAVQINERKPLSPVQQFVFDALVLAIDNYGQHRNTVKDMPPIKCVSYEEFNEALEEKGFKELMETESKTTKQQVKSATQTARLFLQKHNYISFNSKYLWLMNESNKNDGMMEGMKE